MAWIILMVLTLLVSSCGPAKEKREDQSFSGRTMGTTYSIHCFPCQVEKKDIDSLLVDVNLAVSTYIDTSLISLINSSRDSLIEIDTKGVLGQYFIDNLELSLEIFDLTSGAFDPTVMPLVNLWGFGFADRDRSTYPDSAKVDSVMSFVGMNYFGLLRTEKGLFISKSHPLAALDFSAVAKGYGVDVVCEYLQDRGCPNYMVEIGGEVRCMGNSPRNDNWRIGINVPRPGAGTREITLLTPVVNRALATSGNYRNFYKVEGRKVSHSINPGTGYPEINSLLSASIITETCARADALATSCMILGLERAKELIDRLDGVEAYLIFGDQSGDFRAWQSAGFPESEQIE